MTSDWPEVDTDFPVPGSRPRVEHAEPAPKPPPDERPWDYKPRNWRVNGKDVVCFDINALALALNRSKGTIYRWEREGYLPITDIRVPRRLPTFVTKQGIQATNNGRRLYPRAFIEKLIVVADEYGLREQVDEGTVVPPEFVERAHELWTECFPR